ncbi:MAG: hypothetical protein IKQ50_02545 [Paludibacteraceae bacterium]|nr:hypothetical protein [Paludibacteraceae bacterium]
MLTTATCTTHSIKVNGLRVTGYGLPVTGYGLPVTGYGLPVTGYGLREKSFATVRCSTYRAHRFVSKPVPLRGTVAE